MSELKKNIRITDEKHLTPDNIVGIEQPSLCIRRLKASDMG
jgi:hypothetical protein